MKANPSDRTDARYLYYESPLQGRYAGEPMRRLFGAQRKFSTWRRLWLALAQAQKKLGLNITDEQIGQMQEHLDDIDFVAAAEYERRFRHDVMAHIHAFGDAAPSARGIIHLGATSQFVNCNCDLLTMREGLDLLIGHLANIIDVLGDFAATYRDLPTLGFTHYQPAQLTTVGKRAALWCYEFVMDLEELQYRRDNLRLRGAKGATGTQASFLTLFDGDHEKAKALDRELAEQLGLPATYTVTGQTYSRKVDAAIAASLAGAAASVHKFCNDIRLLANLKEMEEPFESGQIGSSAMAYKRNPMRCERATGLARWLMDLSTSPLHTAAEQWFERTLDDSANRRLAIPEAFLTADAILQIVLNVASGLVVYPNVIAAHVAAELPFLTTEKILMAAVMAGGDRQAVHERIRIHSQAAAAEVKSAGKGNDLLDRLKGDDAFAAVDFRSVLDPAGLVGRAPQQVDEFIATHVEPVRKKYADRLGYRPVLEV
ncbi:MAG: adenylosuccinate lyase [Planctomycetes bacterium]|nr:adenylosuccinate lyase [Planctomycetota bacterium]